MVIVHLADEFGKTAGKKDKSSHSTLVHQQIISSVKISNKNSPTELQILDTMFVLWII